MQEVINARLDQYNRIFFIGIAGSGMSALAQYLKGAGKDVSGSDRYFQAGQSNQTRQKLEAEGIRCYEQGGQGITADIELVVVSTAIEDTVPEVQQARHYHIPIIRRSELLAMAAAAKKTIAVGGTSGKSTTSAMLYDIMKTAGLEPSIISGAGLVSIIRDGKIGNAAVGRGEWLIIEADESDGSIVQYHPELGLLLNVDKDHKELDALLEIFTIFRNNSKHFIANQGHPLARELSANPDIDFSADPRHPAGYMADGFQQEGVEIRFAVNGKAFRLQAPGRHNMENALAAIAAAAWVGVDLDTAAKALSRYEGIYRRHQVLGQYNGITVIDDFAHNPVKCAASIQACQPLASRVIAWFQPHGYGPTKFLRQDFVHELSSVLRPDDEIWMSEIYYAGGTAVKDISAADLVSDLRDKGKSAYFVENRSDLVKAVKPHLSGNCVFLLMGARDPSLEEFAQQVWAEIKK